MNIVITIMNIGIQKDCFQQAENRNDFSSNNLKPTFIIYYSIT